MNNGENGYLKVIVRTARGAVPISDAVVTISTAEGEASEVLKVLYTNTSGITETYPLSAPPKAYSAAPDLGVPYTNYNIDIVKEGFYAIEKINVTVYSGVTAVLPVEMVPIAFNGTDEIFPDSDVTYNESFPPNL